MPAWSYWTAAKFFGRGIRNPNKTPESKLSSQKTKYMQISWVLLCSLTGQARCHGRTSARTGCQPGRRSWQPPPPPHCIGTS